MRRERARKQARASEKASESKRKSKRERARKSESEQERERVKRSWRKSEERIGGWQKGVEEGEKGVWYAKSISIGTKFAGLEASR